MLSTPTVRLRPLDKSDVPLFAAWLSDEEVILNLGMYMPMSLGDEEAWYENQMKQDAVKRPLTIEINTDQGWRPIGNCGLMDLNWRVRCAELGIFIGDKRCWNQGYGTQAMRLLVGHGFATLNLNRIYLRVVSTNARAIRVYEKVGFVHEGCQRAADYKNGQYIDLLMMSLLRSEWKPD